MAPRSGSDPRRRSQPHAARIDRAPLPRSSAGIPALARGLRAARRRLLLFLAPADHPHRDLACATLAWVAEAEGSLLECYYDARPTGSHYGGGLPAGGDVNDLRGGTFTGAHHLEQLLLLLQTFDCEVASLGPAMLGPMLDDAGVPFRSRAGDIATFYADVFDGSAVSMPDTVLVVGQGQTSPVQLTPYAFPEIVNRRLLAIGEGDPDALARLGGARKIEEIWCRAPVQGAAADLRPNQGAAVAEETAWMAERWQTWRRGYLLGDPELVGRWIPFASRKRWVAIHGRPQIDVVKRLAGGLQTTSTIFGRQQDDRDFLELSRIGVAFQLIDPGRPPFPALAERPRSWPATPATEDPPDEQLWAWARERRIVTTLLFWTGMARELESLYPLADVLSLTGMRAGLLLTIESFAHMSWPPLTLTRVGRDRGGLAGQVEVLLASAGTGAMIESEAPVDRFASTLRDARNRLAELIGPEGAPRGWWPVMDAPLIRRDLHRVHTDTQAPFIRIRYEPRPLGSAPADDPGRSNSFSLRSMVRDTPLRHLFEPIRPFSGFRPGQPGRRVLTEARSAGFGYAFTASSFSGAPRAVVDVPGLTVLNYTAGRWDGWTPFITVPGLAELRRAERRLLNAERPGWLIGTIDSCLWAFSGPVWDRGRELFEMCSWIAAGGSSGRLINVTPRTAARYARLLADAGQVATLRSR